jgi:hypothetical protein
MVAREGDAPMNIVDRWNTENGIRRSEQATLERAHTAQLAHHLSTVAVRQWEKTLTGIVAFPAAAALGVAATATYGVALLERGFDVFEMAVGEIGRSLTLDRREGHETEEHRTPRPEARS